MAFRSRGCPWNKSLDRAGVMIGDAVDISLEVELVKRRDAKWAD